METKRVFLEDVVLIRCVLIILLVLYHAFAIFNGAWDMPLGVSDNLSYWWVASFSYAFMLEAFVFISGYILGFQKNKKGASIFTFNSLISKKIKRLLLPSLFFSIIYYILFYDVKQPVINILCSILNGCGHLWFLPMLFWCFVITYILNKLQLKNSLIFLLAFGCSLCSFLPLPLRISSALYYYLFFYLGFWCSIHQACITRFINYKSVVLSACLFLGLFVSLTVVKNSGGVNNMLLCSELASKIVKYLLLNLFKVAYSTCGVIFLLLIVRLSLKENIINVSSLLYKFSTLCFGVYIYQQFILKHLYYYSGFTQICSPLLLPWVGFFIALTGSILLSWFTIKTKFGRFLIG